MKDLDCPVVVICGASAGVGRATAHAFAAAGYSIGLIARSDEGLALTVEELQSYDVAALAISVDVAEAEALALAAQRFETELGPIDVWINSAMVTVFAPVEQLTPGEIKRVTEVTYLGTVHGTLAALSFMRSRNRGVIIQVGSALAYRAIPLQSAYCGAKFAVRGFTDSLRCELIHQRSNINVCMVQLPAMNTPQFDWACNKLGKRVQPVPPIHDPYVAARAILSVVNAPPRELWLGMTTIKAIMGTLFFPGLLDRLLARRAWSGQMVDNTQPTPQAGNLFEPVNGLHEVRGRFTRNSRKRAWGLSSSRVIAVLAITAALLVLLIL
ncbi:short-chain dehydrogenase [Pseudomonas daroniae]|uniref:Short-chain dehydrogenase n=1 Tax=Phytopseudomonas daroniae TaxID=2487519 RepID=A0A4Q9QK27_9GAMM|nr:MULTISPECIES: SDR family oxidoreductase [Pseudomonas]TBU73691.1 short-chain dehydrogenase [Pseudomonas daroniae]TBU77877.1 short-chain dehydrogenase [Pseudomonas daroniae]TBU82224.1 short-chain dehydrogenase [Pseudomonas sp. FRB 228]TBU91148.1 short-chain dehydrogenase [Pseudomonas daroniae]